MLFVVRLRNCELYRFCSWLGTSSRIVLSKMTVDLNKGLKKSSSFSFFSCMRVCSVRVRCLLLRIEIELKFQNMTSV